MPRTSHFAIRHSLFLYRPAASFLRRSILFRANHPQVAKIVDAGRVAVGPGDLDGVVADEPGVGEDRGLIDVGGQHGQRQALMRRRRFASRSTTGTGAVLAEIIERIAAHAAVGPLDLQPGAAVEVQIDRLEAGIAGGTVDGVGDCLIA